MPEQTAPTVSSGTPRVYRTADLFAGIGGIRLGFEHAFGADRVETIFVSEFNPPAVKTYAANFETPATPCSEEAGKPLSERPFVYGDITTIPTNAIPDIDLVLAGFPCQAFSYAGKKMGFDDNYRGKTRGTLFREVVRIGEDKQPLVIFCENVKGLLSHDKGKTFRIIVESFKEIGYTVFHKVLNSRDFGVPQNRERVYIVAFRNDIAPNEFIYPEPTDSSRRIRGIMEDAPIPSRYYVSSQYLASMEQRTARNRAAGRGFGHIIRDIDGVSGALVCGGMGRERNLVRDPRPHSMVPTTRISGGINNRDIRFLTPREWARLQGYPDSYVLPCSDSQTYKQLGNSVTVPVIEAIAQNIRRVLDSGAK